MSNAPPIPLTEVPCPACDRPVVLGVDPQGRPVLLDALYQVYDLTPATDSQGRYPVVRSRALVAHAGVCPRTRAERLGDTYV